MQVFSCIFPLSAFFLFCPDLSDDLIPFYCAAVWTDQLIQIDHPIQTALVSGLVHRLSIPGISIADGTICDRPICLSFRHFYKLTILDLIHGIIIVIHMTSAVAEQISFFQITQAIRPETLRNHGPRTLIPGADLSSACCCTVLDQEFRYLIFIDIKQGILCGSIIAVSAF